MENVRQISLVQLLTKIKRILRENVIFYSKVIAIILGIGLVDVYFREVNYTSQVKLMPELEGKSASNFKQFSALAEIVGINISGSKGAIEAVRPDLYPDVLQSVPFLLHLMHLKVFDNNRTTLFDFLSERDVGMDWFKEDKVLIPALPEPNTPIKLDKSQAAFVESLGRRITATLDKRNGIITIEAKMPDPQIASQVVRFATTYLQEYVTAYRTEKSRNDEVFLTKRVQEALNRYQKAEYAWAKYKDQHRYLVTQLSDIEGRRLESEYVLTQSLYNELNKQLEQAKIKVQEETPVFKILEPAQVPSKKSEPKRLLILMIYFIFGVVFGLFIIMIRHSFSEDEV